MKPQAERLLSVVAIAGPRLVEISAEASAQPALPGGWSARELVAHLIDSASNNHQRFVRAAQQEELHFPGYNQSENISVQRPVEADWTVLVALWGSYNRYLAHVIACLPAAKLETACFIGDSPAVTLRFLVEDYLVHLEHHLRQLHITL